ncbi:unnamed protein product [Paramecium sonneborni]|uniref:Uncharacterized protein n=1 Tax=Paramecium sonneborni TaxID=65129 RepID=A0A8S1KJE5_9CILI|nr:unnamed protein product [Paramecium sonneborni]
MCQYEQIRPIVFQKALEGKQIRSNSLAIHSSPFKQQFEYSFNLEVNSIKNQANQHFQEINNFKKLQVGESCSSNHKENQYSGKQFSFRMDETSFLKQRIKQLENQNTTYMSENKKLTHVLDQQIKLNQTLQDQYQSKKQIIRKMEDVQKLNKNQLPNNTELKQMNDQLIIQKQLVSDLEEKLQYKKIRK